MTKARDIASASPAPSTVSATELGYLDGVSSAIQTQIDGKVASSLVDAKGDLLVGSADNTLSRLAVSDNGSTLVADSSTSTGLRWQGNFAAGKNKIINGDFAINQRAFTSRTTNGFGFDRFGYIYGDGTVTYSAQTFTAGAAPVAGYEAANFARIATASQTAAGAYSILQHKIEDVRTLAGQTSTLSFWAKANSGTPKIAVELEQFFGTGGSPSATTQNYFGQVTLSTSWVRYSLTFTIPSLSGKTVGTDANTSHLIWNLWTSAGSSFNSRTGSLGIQNSTIDFWGVQLEAGSVATAFQTATGTLAGELAACQRYYWRSYGSGSNANWGFGQVPASGYSITAMQNPVRMRVAATSIDTNNLFFYDPIPATNYTVDSITTVNNTDSTSILRFNKSTLTNVGRVGYLNGDTTSYIGFNAEL